MAAQRSLGHEFAAKTLDTYSVSFDTDLDVAAEAMDAARKADRGNRVRTKIGQQKISGIRKAPLAFINSGQAGLDYSWRWREYPLDLSHQ